MELSGLSPSTTYCYRIYGAGTPPPDLLGSNSSPEFTTLAPASSSATAPVTFDVLGDTGETDYGTGVPFANNFNPDQAAIDDLIGQSGASFAVVAGDMSYSGGTQADFGDLQQTGSEVSNIFGPSYWPETGGIPLFYADGNHGQNTTALHNWPESATAAASDGEYADVSYPSIDGDSAAAYPQGWYAFSTGNVRIYVLDAAWADGNVGSASGSECSPVTAGCAMYQVDADAHWEQTSAEYQWLAQDLASHPGGIKFAIFHFPLRSDNATEPSDPYLQNSSANPDAQQSLEALLSANGVDIAFNAHAHTYQRIEPDGPGQVLNYVTGGGGGILEPVLGGSTCQALETTESIYALGWSPTSGLGSSCGAPTPQSAAQVYNFLKVTVSGDNVTVSPENATGQVFDQQTYNFAGGATPTPTPTPSGSPTVTSVQPPSGVATGGTGVTIEGSNFATGATIKFGNASATGVSVNSSTSITATSPAGTAGTTVDVTVTSSVGTSADSGGDQFTYLAPPGRYVALTPARICDTRAGNPSDLTGALAQCNGRTLAAGASLAVQVAGDGGVPSSGVSAVVLNVTAVANSQATYVTVYPEGSSAPLASNLNLVPGETMPNLAVAALGIGGQVAIYNAEGRTDVIVDVEGYYSTTGSGVPFAALAPARICDTRTTAQAEAGPDECTGQTLGAGQTMDVQVTGEGGVPSGASAVVAHVTVTDTSTSSYLSLWSAGGSRPATSNLNWSPGETVANQVILPLSAAGQVSLYNAVGSTDVIIDVDGYFSTSAADLYQPTSPVRVCDTRGSSASNQCSGQTLSPGGTLSVQITGRDGVPADATAVVINVTATEGTAPSYLTVFPSGEEPLASDLNFYAGQTVPDLVVVKLSSSGGFQVYNDAGNVDVIVDIEGWYQ
ncbi:MAG TPA: IPT/TIG domain-containing protein [Candidatus Dormibacteraeota bacterium]